MDEMASEIKKLGVPPTSDYKIGGQDVYTVPTIYDPNTDRAVTDSQKIVDYLEEQYPETPSLFPPGTRALQSLFVSANYMDLLSSVLPIILADCLRVGTERNAAYFRRTREPLPGGVTIEQAQLKGEARVQAIQRFIDKLGVIDEVIRVHGDNSTFITGDSPANADINIAAVLTQIRRAAGSDSDIWRSILDAHGGRWARLMDALEPFRVVD